MSKIELIDGRPEVAKFHCPTCKSVAPPYGFHMNGGNLGLVGLVLYMTVHCAAEIEPADDEKKTPAKICGAILTVNILQHQPPTDPVLRAKLNAMMAAAQQAMGKMGGN